MNGAEPSTILVSGASGLIGSALVGTLRGAGSTVVPLSRVGSSSAATGPRWDVAAKTIELGGCGPLTAVVHLAGETVAQRWSSAARRRMWDSRCSGTRALGEALARLPQPPRTLVCASAIGYYGDRGDDWLDETAKPGEGFLAELAQAWEAAAAPARAAGLRVAHLRFGIVLSPAGGALAKMLPVFRLGLAGKLGDGRQYWSWLSREDAVGAIRHVLERDNLEGAVNVVSPNPVTNLEFTRALGAVVRRPAWLGVPRFAIEGVFGQMGRELFLSSCRVKPGRLLATNFPFRHPDLGPALEQMLQKS